MPSYHVVSSMQVRVAALSMLLIGMVLGAAIVHIKRPAPIVPTYSLCRNAGLDYLKDNLTGTVACFAACDELRSMKLSSPIQGAAK